MARPKPAAEAAAVPPRPAASPLLAEEVFYSSNMHTVEITNHKQLSNGQLAVLGRCCGDDSTQSWHTMASAVVTDPTKLQDSLNWFHNRVATEHEAMIQSKVIVANLIGTSTKIDLSQAAPAPAEPAPQTTTVQ